MMKKKICSSLFVIGIIASLSSCEYTSNPVMNNDGTSANASRGAEGRGGSNGEGGTTYTINYLNDIKPLLTNNCMPCHGAAAPKNWLNYNTVVNNIDLILGSINHDSGFKPMPVSKAKLDADLIQLVQDWADTGMAYEQSTTDTGSTSPTNPRPGNPNPTNPTPTEPVPVPTPTEPAPIPDTEHFGKKLYENSCVACHGDMNSYPRIVGQNKGYLKTELNHFKKKDREDVLMNYYVGQYLNTDQEVEFIARYLSELDPCSVKQVEVELMLDPTDAKADIVAGKKLYETQCILCHSNSSAGNIPYLEGQNSNYLLKTLQELKDGDRPATMMKSVLTNTTRKQMIDVSKYLNSKSGCEK